MRGEPDEALTRKRLEELAERAERTGVPCYTEFLSPPEAEHALAAARRRGVSCCLDGGYEDAERRVARFGDGDEPFPIAAIELMWLHQPAPTHRDLLGAVMALGLKRGVIGDIVPQSERACLFALERMAGVLMDGLASAGRTRLTLRLLDAPDTLAPVAGAEVRDTVMSLRLDAIVASGFALSRAQVAELIAAGKVKLRHLPTERPDARVGEGDAISVRGMGRLAVLSVGAPTRKGRIPLVLTRFGSRRGR